MSSSLAIQVEGLGKRYQRGTTRSRHDSLRDLIMDGLGSMFRRSPPDEGTFWALKEACFDIRHGENVGIIGLNGAGKSTLLKILSRITTPTTGRARIDGRVGALLEVGTGFHADLTGRENTFLYGSILGMSREEIRRKFDDIVEFAGIQEFMDLPVKRYSSGMYVRLAFAVAAHLEPEILLLDEVLAVGDYAFQRKCIEFAKSLQRKNATILFVSHNMFSIKTMCERTIYLKKGQIQFDGPTERGIQLYEEDCGLSALPWLKTKPEDMPFVVTGCTMRGADGVNRKMFDFGEAVTLRIEFEARSRLRDVHLVIALIRSDGIAACNYSSKADGAELTDLDGKGFVELTISDLKLVAELYSVSILVRDAANESLLCGQVGMTFHVRHPLFDTHYGVFHEDARWRIERG